MSDYIEKNRLITAITNCIYGVNGDVITASEKKAIIGTINNQPTADVRENIKGEWIIHNSYGREYLECPYCRTYFLHEHLVRNSFCPSCGADMRGEV